MEKRFEIGQCSPKKDTERVNQAICAGMNGAFFPRHTNTASSISKEEKGKVILQETKGEEQSK